MLCREGSMRGNRRHHYREEYYLNTHGNQGLDEIHTRVRSAEIASTKLREETNKAILNWARRHGVRTDQARTLLLDRRMP
jgi:hypothetical protein